MQQNNLSDELQGKLDLHKKWLQNQLDGSSNDQEQEESQNNDILDDHNNPPRNGQSYGQDVKSNYNEQDTDELSGSQSNTGKNVDQNQRQLQQDRKSGLSLNLRQNTNKKVQNSFEPTSNESYPQNTTDSEQQGSPGQNQMEYSTEQKNMLSSGDDRSKLPIKIHYDLDDDDSKPKSRWEALYSMNKQKQEKVQQALQKKKQEQEELDPQCTFQPKILNNPRYSYTQQNSLMFADRSVLWKQNKQTKLEQVRKKDEDKDIKDCTFHPTILAPDYKKLNETNLAAQMSSKGVDKFLRRQVMARQTKEEKEMILQNPLVKLPDYSSSKKATNNLTIPKHPKLGRTSASFLNSLKKPMAPDYFSAFSSKGISGSNQNSPTKEDPEDRHASMLKEITNTSDSIYVSNVTFGEAIRILHNELHKIEINID